VHQVTDDKPLTIAELMGYHRQLIFQLQEVEEQHGVDHKELRTLRSGIEIIAAMIEDKHDDEED
jgi:hypothetical protein